METRKEERREFHREGPMVRNDLACAKVVLVRGTSDHAGPKRGKVGEKLQNEESDPKPIMLSVQFFGGP